MDLKNIILFFCVTFYFLQCQGARPTSDQMDTIKSSVTLWFLLQDGIHFEKIKTIFRHVADILNITYEPSTLNNYEKIKLSRDDVEIFTLAFVVSEHAALLNFINEIVAEHMGQDEYMSDLKLREVLAKIKERADFDGRFPEIVGQCISNTLQKTANNYRFTFSDVKNYALAYVASGNPDVMEIVHNAVIAHEKPDGMDYEAFRKVIEDVIRTLEVQKPVPSYDEFKADVLSRIFSVNGIENLIIETLFPL